MPVTKEQAPSSVGSANLKSKLIAPKRSHADNSLIKYLDLIANSSMQQAELDFGWVNEPLSKDVLISFDTQVTMDESVNELFRLEEKTEQVGN